MKFGQLIEQNVIWFSCISSLLVLEIFKFLSCLEKQLNWKDKVDIKTYDVTTWLTNNCNTHIAHIAQYLKK